MSQPRAAHRCILVTAHSTDIHTANVRHGALAGDPIARVQEAFGVGGPADHMSSLFATSLHVWCWVAMWKVEHGGCENVRENADESRWAARGRLTKERHSVPDMQRIPHGASTHENRERGGREAGTSGELQPPSADSSSGVAQIAMGATKISHQLQCHELNKTCMSDFRRRSICIHCRLTARDRLNLRLDFDLS
jgi:hypothetical protein